VLALFRGELGAEEDDPSVSDSDVHSDSSGDVLQPSAVSGPRASSNPSPMLHPDKPQDVKEYLQEDKGSSHIAPFFFMYD